MPARSKILMLPPEIKAELDRRLITGSFANYEAQTEWLNEQLREAGLEISISRSAVHNYGQGFESRIAAIKIATEQAKAITDAVGDDAGKMGNALISLVQEKAFDVLVRMTDLDPADMDFNKLTVAIAKLNNAAVAQKKWQTEIKKKATVAADEVVKVAKAGGLPKDKAEWIKKKILGIV